MQRKSLDFAKMQSTPASDPYMTPLLKVCSSGSNAQTQGCVNEFWDKAQNFHFSGKAGRDFIFLVIL